MSDDIHSCSLYCERPACIKAQRDQLRDAHAAAVEVCNETYQVVGVLLADLGIFQTDRAEKILDNLSEQQRVHKDVLPWESIPKTPNAELKNLREIAAAFLPVMEAMRPLVLNLERLKDAAKNAGPVS